MQPTGVFSGEVDWQAWGHTLTVLGVLLAAVVYSGVMLVLALQSAWQCWKAKK